jgi:hypothetical protein
VPSLDLRFADNKSLVDAVTGASLVTFTRASDGTVTDSAGVIQTATTDVPRFDHNPTTGESLGLLVEEQRTNLLLRSEEFDTGWTGSESNTTITANTNTAPNGTLTADTIDFTDASAFRYQVVSNVAAGTAVTFSVWLASGTKTQAVIRIAGTSTGTGGQLVVSLTPTLTRYSVTVTIPSGNTAIFVGFENRVGVGGGNGSIGTIIPWGAQLEAASTPSSYIPTTTAAVTRSASLADLISSAIANNIRTLYLEFRSPASGTRGVVSLNDNTANERASVLTSGTDPLLVVVDGGVEQANVNGGTVTANQRTRIAVRINANDFAISINGGAVVTNTSGTLPTVDRLMLGRTQAGEYLNGTIARVTGWTQLLPDSTLQSLAQ